MHRHRKPFFSSIIIRKFAGQSSFIDGVSKFVYQILIGKHPSFIAIDEKLKAIAVPYLNIQFTDSINENRITSFINGLHIQNFVKCLTL